MHIAINAHLLAHTRSFRRAGVSHYIEQVLLHLGQIDTSNDYRIYTTRGLDGAALGLPANFRVIPSRLPTINPRVRIPWEQVIAPMLLRQSGASVFHGTLNVVPLLCPVPSVVTVHDLAFIRFPQTFRAYNRTYLDFATRTSVQRAARVLAVSEHTKHEVAGLLGVPAERIDVTPNAARASFRPPDPAVLARFRQQHNLPERFLLYVGTLEPRKNLLTLLDAYSQVRKAVQVPLMIGGGKGWFYQPVFERVEALGLQAHVHFAGYIPEDDLPLWYAAAHVFVFPSLYEGFGMPPLEAMSCGTPVVTSNSTSLPEVVGNAGLQVPPTDAEALAAALLRLLQQPDLWGHMREQGLQRAAHFSWRATAERTRAAYLAVGTQTG